MSKAIVVVGQDKAARDFRFGPVPENTTIPRAQAPAARAFHVDVVDDRPLMADCLARGLQAFSPGMTTRHFGSLEALTKAIAGEGAEGRLVLLACDWSVEAAEGRIGEIASFTRMHPQVGLVVISSIASSDEVLALIEAGARGYISTRDTLEVAAIAIQLVRAGGVYVSADPRFRAAAARSPADGEPAKRDLDLTPRQMAVVEGLRKGKSNKIIAYELNMCESTVKVHIRTIMKKLHARNRTEAAYKMTQLLGSQPFGSLGPQ